MHVIDTIRSAGQIIENYDPKGRCKIRNYQFYYSYEFGSNPYYRGKIVGGEVKIGYEGRYSLNYTEFFAFLAPQMFLGLAYVRSVCNNEFAWLCTLGWEK